MSRRRIPYRLEEFRGEFNREGQTNQRVFGRGGRMLYRLRGYTLDSYGRAAKRHGYDNYVATAIATGQPTQGMAMYEFGNTRNLVGIANGNIKHLDEGAGTWTDISGSTAWTGGKDLHTRFGFFNDGTDMVLMMANGTDRPIIWKGAGSNAEFLPGVAAPTQAVDIKEFAGHIFTLYEHSIEYSRFGAFDWSSNNVIDATRDSLGVAMTQHSTRALLIFYGRQVYQVVVNEREGALFRSYPLEGSEGCVSSASVVTKDGYSYYAGDRGIYRLGRLEYPAKFIGHPVEEFWNECNKSRRPQVVGIAGPGDEIYYLVSYASSTEHNALMVWNTVLEAWTIFPISGTSSKLKFNSGCTWRDTDRIDYLVLGGYDGFAYDCFRQDSKNYTDDGAPVATEFATGYLDYGWPGISSLRQIIIDGETSVAKSFTLNVDVMGATTAFNKTFTVGKGGDVLNTTFMLNSSILSLGTLGASQTSVSASGRYIKVTLSENSELAPHVISGVDFPHLNKGLRI